MNLAFVGYEELKCRSRGVLSTEAENTLLCTILHILQKLNSLIVLLFIQNNSWFKNKLKHAYVCRCYVHLDSACLEVKGLFRSANMLQIADVVKRVVVLLCF